MSNLYNNNRYIKQGNNFDKKPSDYSLMTKDSSVGMNKKEDKPQVLGAPIKNEIGEQNCFLNVLLHAIYNIKEIRNFLLEEEIKNEDRLYLFYELRNIFEHYSALVEQGARHVDQLKAIDPRELREELARLFKQDGKFRMNSMDDPVEALFAILNAFHSYSVDAQSLKYISDKPCNPPCLPHSLFWINILEQFQCQCGATSEVLKYDYNYFMYEAYVREILNWVKNANEVKDFRGKFFTYLKNLSSCTTNQCPEKCPSGRVTKNMFLLNSSPYLCFNLIWRETNPKLTDICKLFIMLPLKFTNRDLFNLADEAIFTSYDLFGLVCYWGAHYICFFKSEEGDFWVSYDDTIVSKIYNFTQVITKCIKSHFHPTILFYKKTNEKSLYKMVDMQDKIEEEFTKMIAYCQKFDNENQLPYKNDEVEANRLRPSSNSKKVSDSLIDKEKFMKITMTSSNSNKKVSDFDEDGNVVMKNEDNEDKVENINKINSKVNSSSNLNNLNKPVLLDNSNYNLINNFDNDPPLLAEDEWICDFGKCKNVNKITNYQCLKCQQINFNIWDLIKQIDYTKAHGNAFQYNLSETSNNSRKRDQSLQPKRTNMDLNSNTNFNAGSKSTTSNNSNSNMNQPNYSNLRSKITCEYCNHKNPSGKITCEICNRILTLGQSKIVVERSVNNERNRNYCDIGNNYIGKEEMKINSNYNHNNNNNVGNNNNYNILNNNLMNKNWICNYCKVFNFNINFCYKCHKSPQGKNTTDNNASGTPRQQNSFLMNSSKSYINPNMNKNERPSNNAYNTNPVYNPLANSVKIPNVSLNDQNLRRAPNNPINVVNASYNHPPSSEPSHNHNININSGKKNSLTGNSLNPSTSLTNKPFSPNTRSKSLTRNTPKSRK